MSVFRVEKTKGYTVMSNHHLRNHTLSLKAKGLLSQMLSLPEDWDYTLQGLAQINKESIDAIREAVRELERAGYIERSRERDERGCLRGTVYTIYEQPHTEPTPEEPAQVKPALDKPTLEKPMLEKPALENPTHDAVITDPPYASGGRTQAEKSKATAKKYSSMGGNAPPDFDGDAKDQRSWTRWAAEWLYLARRAAKPGAPVCMFIDWRQLPCASDALQWAGWIWRGIAVWDKGNSRPQKGRFRQQAEYIVWGSNGDMPVSRPVPCLPGVFKYGNPQNRIHLTEKPLQLMQDLVKITEPGGHILDPFAGSGTTVLAAVKEGYDATGIEVTDVYADLARKRLEAELNAA